jgi:hypothetical protein
MAVLDNDRNRACTALDSLCVDAREPWMPVSTLANLKLVRECREQRGERQQWYLDVETEVQQLPKAQAAEA